MKLKLDENIGQRGVQLLHQAGHDVATVVEQGLKSAFDSDLIEVCRTEGRCLVTLDLDFSNPLRFNPTQILHQTDSKSDRLQFFYMNRQ